MKEHDIKLTLQETEQLCRLYMDCKLSVLEETELQYVLGKLPYSSPCIDEVRMLMGLSLKRSIIRKTVSPPYLRRILTLTIGMAASIALLIGFFGYGSKSHNAPDNYIVAYENGHRLSRHQAEAAVEASIEKAQALMNSARAFQQAEIAKQEYLINLSNRSK
jgi:hypothetical protein